MNWALPVTLVRSPTLTKLVCRGDQQRFQPGRRGMAGQRRSCRVRQRRHLPGGQAAPATAFSIAAICAGVVPQQPPTDVQQAAVGEFAQHAGHVFRVSS